MSLMIATTSTDEAGVNQQQLSALITNNRVFFKLKETVNLHETVANIWHRRFIALALSGRQLIIAVTLSRTYW